MVKTLKFNFFQVVMPKDAKSKFEDVIQKIAEFKGIERVFSNGEYPVRLQEIRPYENFIVCDIARIRMNDIPDKMKLTGETNDLALDEDEGLGEVTSFLYSPKLQVLLFMRNRNSVSITALSNYIENKGLLYGVQYVPILQEDAYKRLTGLDILQRLDLQVAAPGNGAIFSELGLSDGKNIDLFKTAPRMRITCSISMGYSKQSLPKKALLAFVTNIIQRPKQADESIDLVISGREKDLEKEVIDLFEDVLTDHFDVNIKKQRKITDDQRLNAITSVWLKQSDTIQKILGELDT